MNALIEIGGKVTVVNDLFSSSLEYRMKWIHKESQYMKIFKLFDYPSKTSAHY